MAFFFFLSLYWVGGVFLSFYLVAHSGREDTGHFKSDQVKHMGGLLYVRESMMRWMSIK